jgi:hypothetical protein
MAKISARECENTKYKPCALHGDSNKHKHQMSRPCINIRLSVEPAVGTECGAGAGAGGSASVAVGGLKRVCVQVTERMC